MKDKLTQILTQICECIGTKHFNYFVLANDIEDIKINKTENKYLRIHNLLNHFFPILEKQNINLAIDTYAIMQELKKKF